jgi:protocatechuate 3,4-dioxygenase beta subunit
MRLTTSLAILLCTAALAGQVQSVAPASQLSQAQTPSMTFPVKGTALISGQVIDANGDGVANAVVTLNGGLQQVALTIQVGEIPGGPRRTLTNSEGHFVFFDLAAGSYSIDVTKPGFLPGAYGRRRAGGPSQSVRIADAERKTRLEVRVWEHAAISGRLLDEAGEPMVGVQVRALNRVFWRGRAQWALGPTATTDDRGVYRLDAIEPGEYLVVVPATPITLPTTVLDTIAAEQQSGGTPATMMQLMRSGLASTTLLTGATRVGEWSIMTATRAPVPPTPPNHSRTSTYPTTFHPGTRSLSSAQSVVVASGEERAGVDFALPLTPAATIRGVVTGPDGPVAGVALQLLPEYADLLSVDGLDAAGAVTDAAGRFAMIGVAAGNYTLRSVANPGARVGVPASTPMTQGYWLMQPVSVTDTDLPELSLVMRPGLTVRGRIEFDGTSPKPGPELVQKLFAGLEPLDPNMPRAQGTYQVNFDRNGQFVIPNVVPGRYSVRYAAFLSERQAMPGWETVGGMLNGKDVSSGPLSITSDLDGIVIVLTDRPSELSGTVRAANGNIDPDAAVILFPADKALWTSMPSFTRRMRMVRATEDGTFLMRGIPAGDFILAAIPEEEAADWQDPRVLDRLMPGGARVTINVGDKKMHDLRTRTSR